MTNESFLIPNVTDELHVIPKMSHDIAVGIDINKLKSIAVFMIPMIIYGAYLMVIWWDKLHY